MRKFIKLSIVFSFVVLLLSLFADYKISQFLRYNSYYIGCSNSHHCKAWGNIYNYKQSADIVINGNSKALREYNPAIIDSILHVNSYNLGMSGSMINRQILKYYAYCKIQDCQPKLLIQNIDYLTIDITRGFRKEQFFPMFIYDRELMEQFSEYEHFNILEKYCPAYRYWGYPYIVQCAFGLNHFCCIDTLSKGFAGVNWDWDGTKYLNVKKIECAKDSQALVKFCEFISDVISSGTKVLFVYAPLYIGATNKIVNIEGMYEMYDTIAKKYDIPILDYNYDPICYDTTYFYNATHLNRKGAELFTTKLAHDIDSLGLLK